MAMARSTPAQNPLGLANRTSMARILRLLSGAGRAQPVEDQQPRARRDRGIRDVERPEVPAERVNGQKIQNVTERDPVPDVAERPSEDQRQTGAHQPPPPMPRGQGP